jgi:hypothetical protein
MEWCAVGGVRHPQHTQTSSNSSTKAADSSNGVTNTKCCRRVVCAPDDGWKYHPKHVEQFSDINKLCNVASCWIYIGILLGARPFLHISRIKVNCLQENLQPSLVVTYCLSNPITEERGLTFIPYIGITLQDMRETFTVPKEFRSVFRD